MSVYKVVGSILDLSGDVAVYAMHEARFIRALTEAHARAIFARAFGGVADTARYIGPNHAANVGFATVYDEAAGTMDRQRPGMYRPTSRAIARCVAVKHARAATGASAAMAKAKRRIAALQRAAGLPVRVKA